MAAVLNGEVAPLLVDPDPLSKGAIIEPPVTEHLVPMDRSPGTSAEVPAPAAGETTVRSAPISTAPVPTADVPDLAYGAFQRGLYLTAFDLALARAKVGDSKAQTLVGLIYEGDYGAKSDLNEAIAWYRRAAEAGDRDARFALGKMYLGGRGVPADASRAADYFEQAADRGQTQAIYNLGLVYLEGKGRSRDLAKAESLLERAARAGNSIASPWRRP